tara:strand:+ start:869 stop:1885 length:1017 start_codon:yes stop_codon:yes gene_type:complete
MALINNIAVLRKNHILSKHEQLVQGVIEGIEKGDFEIGDKLPSINTMVREVGYARKTIVKAYEELKDRGLVESKKLKGYYIISQETKTTLKVALVLYAFQSFHEEFYNTFRNALGNRYQIDVFFHHNNLQIFETIISNIKGKYGKYVIAPIQNATIVPLLQDISPEKLLIIDRYLFLGKEYSYISQEFEKGIYTKLVELVDAIKQYDRFILFVKEDTDYTPIGILRAFSKFLKTYDIEGSIQRSYTPNSVEKGTLYFIINDNILWQVLRDCVRQHIVIGKDIGIFSHDDSISKEIAFGGITTSSTDFKEMAKKAADQVKYGHTIKTIMPFKLNRRNSL